MTQADLVERALDYVWTLHNFEMIDGRLKVHQHGDRDYVPRWVDAYETIQTVTVLVLGNDYTRTILGKVQHRVRIRAMSGGRLAFPVEPNLLR